VDRVLADFAACQGGVVSVQQLHEAAVTDREIDRRMLSGHLHRHHVGVLIVGHPRITEEGRRFAAVLACGPGTALAGWSCAVHRGYLERDGPRIHVAVTGMRSLRRDGIHPHRTVLEPHEVEIVGGLRCTSVARMLQELAASNGPAVVEKVWREAVYRRSLNTRAVRELLDRRKGERGTVVLRELYLRRMAMVGRVNGFTEQLLLPIIRRSGLPEPRVNDPIEVGGHRFIVDFHFPELRLVIDG
jgi:hypothetical protein